VLYFDPEKPPNIQDQATMWLKPLKWNQGGYDAVYVDRKNQLIRFVQITRGNEHSFKIQYFFDLLEKFSKKFETKTLEIYFLVPKKQLLIFNIPNSKVEGQGLLKPFWGENKEINQVKIRGIEGIN